MNGDEPAIDGFRTGRAQCVLAPNPSRLTLDGTNTWVLAEPGSDQVLVLDPGPQDEEHLRRVLAVATAGGTRGVAQVLLSHGHPDHSEGAARFAALASEPASGGRTGPVPVRAVSPAWGGASLRDGAEIAAGDLRVRVIASPGHSSDSVSLLLPAEGTLLTGDTVLGRGTAVIAPDGDLGDYLRTLDRLQDLVSTTGVRLLLPGHGPPLPEPPAVLDRYRSHREQRLDQIRSALAAGATSAAEVVAIVYADVDRALWPAAEWSVRAQLAYLRAPHPPSQPAS